MTRTRHLAGTLVLLVGACTAGTGQAGSGQTTAITTTTTAPTTTTPPSTTTTRDDHGDGTSIRQRR